MSAGLMLTAVLRLAAQSQPAPGIEAVSIKRNTTGGNASSLGPRPGGYVAVNVPVHMFMGLAFPALGVEVVGAPDWFYDEPYDLNARIVGAPDAAQSRALWRAVFAERMKLQAHLETREQPIFAMVLARDGRVSPNLKRVETDCATVIAARERGEAPPAQPAAANGAGRCDLKMGRTGVISGGTSMAALARLVQPTTGRRVVDRTGLDGYYEFSLTLSPTRPNAQVTPTGNELPTVFTALQEQLGLKLESARGPVDFLVIDHVERPTED